MHIRTFVDWSIKGMLNRRQAEPDRLPVNREYQRGNSAWTTAQQKMFIDSVLRGYPIPAFYLHDESEQRISITAERPYWIIDGQQRLVAMAKFVDDKLRLNEPPAPGKARSSTSAPYFSTEIECTWGGCVWSRLPPEVREKFLAQPLAVHVVQTLDQNIVRDLFIRLQGGSPLTAQQRRDAFPGPFPEYIKKIGGFPEHPTPNPYGDGHDLFTTYAYGGGDASRQLAAQLWLLTYELCTPPGRIAPCGSRQLDQLYACNVDFDEGAQITKTYEMRLDLLGRCLAKGKRRSRKYGRSFVLDTWIALHELLNDDRALPAIHADPKRVGDALYDFYEAVQAKQSPGYTFDQQGHIRRVIAYREVGTRFDPDCLRTRSIAIRDDLREVLKLTDLDEEARQVDPTEQALADEAESNADSDEELI